MSEGSSFQKMMARLCHGDDEAAREVFFRFRCRLIGLAAKRLDSRLQQKVDAEDVIQSVFRSFFLRAGQGQYSLKNWEGLWGLLVVITLSKCARKAEYFRAAKRNVQRESNHFPADEGPDFFDREPTPEEAAILTETVEELLRGLDADDREIVVLFLQGYTIPEISRQVDWAERTIQRVLARVRQRLERFQETDHPAEK